MGLFDSIKKVNLGEVTKKAAELADKHEAKIDQGIDKAAHFVDDKTGRKHHDKVDGGAAKLKGTARRGSQIVSGCIALTTVQSNAVRRTFS